jgi:hypothetical protein
MISREKTLTSSDPRIGMNPAKNSGHSIREPLRMNTGSNGNIDAYEILGLDRNAGHEEIKKAFHKLALKYHPDRNQGNDKAAERFRQVLEAYRNLTDGKDEDGKDEEDHSDQDKKSEGSENVGKGFRFNYGAKMESNAHPRCPGCSIDGMEHIICKKGGDAISGRKKMTAVPFMVIFCDKCGHVYNVFNTGL